MKNFEENLRRLEELSSSIKKSDVTLEEALKSFEEGIRLAKGMEKELDAMESKVQILMNSPSLDEEPEQESDTEPKTKKPRAKKENGPVLDLFSENSEINGTRS